MYLAIGALSWVGCNTVLGVHDWQPLDPDASGAADAMMVDGSEAAVTRDAATGADASVDVSGDTLADALIQGDAPTQIDADSGPGCVGACPGPLATMTLASCAVRDGGVLMCWGDNVSAELGRGTSGGPDPTPQPVQLSDVTALVAGGNGGCSIQRTGGISCWGDSDGLRGLVGMDSGSSIRSPMAAAPLVGASGITMGRDFVCWLNGSGVHCIGTNGFGQLGVGNGGPQAGAVLVPLPSGVTGIVSGIETSCALVRSDGSLWCWGRNSAGQIDLGVNASNVLPPTRVDLHAIGTLVSVRIGSGHMCAILTDTSVACWGANDRGQQGHPTIADHGFGPEGVRVADGVTPLRGATTIALGYRHSCAVVTGGKVKCWGANDFGQLGRGSFDGGGDTPFANDVLTLDDVTEIAAGAFHTCARRSTGDVWCWGANDYAASGGSGAVQAIPNKVLP